jgi:hypothetical protein
MKNFNKMILEITKLATKYRNEWDIKLCDSTDIEQYGFNEYLDGKADTFEECLEILQQIQKSKK